jgi:hypothetical protein
MCNGGELTYCQCDAESQLTTCVIQLPVQSEQTRYTKTLQILSQSWSSYISMKIYRILPVGLICHTKSYIGMAIHQFSSNNRRARRILFSSCQG